jgi:phosphoribosylanthranilate isomerase
VIRRRVKVKICGITNWLDARRAVEAGADFLGFNFYPPSPRYIDPAKARRIVRRLPDKVSSVGIFVNEPEDKIGQIAREVGLKYIQLHGDETPAFVSRLRHALPKLKILKAIRVRKSFDWGKLRSFRGVEAILLDGFDAHRRGGTGRTFNWALARRTAAQRIFLAGGLRPENVAEAIRRARPYAVDVCSGIESSPGKKDGGKMLGLMRAIHGFRSAGKGK